MTFGMAARLQSILAGDRRGTATQTPPPESERRRRGAAHLQTARSHEQAGLSAARNRVYAPVLDVADGSYVNS
jgi:hypothetical protein